MNKQIKYRFWNKIGRFFEKSDKIAVNKDGDLVLYDYETGEWRVVKIEKTCLDVDRFTGIVDKNGKEIYEGDIVKTQGDTALSCGTFWTEISPYGVKFKRIAKKSGKEIIIKANALEYELLGNIHENSDLLTKGR